MSEVKPRSPGRKTKLNKPLQGKVVKLLKQGVSIEDVCSQVDIAVSTYYNWIERGQALADQLDATPDTTIPADELPFLEFLEATTRALQNAKVKAIGAVYGAIQGQKSVEKSKSTFEEIRWRQTKDGKKPYKYRRTSTSEKVIQHPPDPRTAIDYLKRRYPDEWSERLKIDIDLNLLKELSLLAARQNVDLGEMVRALIDEIKSSDDVLPESRP